MKRFVLLVLLAGGLVTAGLGAGQTPTLTADTLKGIRFRSLGPTLTTGRIADIEIDPKNPEHLVRRVRVRRPVEDGQPRRHVRADFRRIHLHPVLRRRRPEGLERRLARHRREHEPAQRPLRRRRLQVDRRGQDLEAGRPRGVGAHRQDPDRPAQFERGVRRIAGTAVLGRRRPRSLQDDRRRCDLDGGADDQRGYRHQRRAVRPEESRYPDRLGLSAPSRGRPDDRRRPRRRHLQVD